MEKMLGVIGIRKEDKDITEHRAPMSPSLVEEIIKQHNLTVKVEPAENRIFTDEEYKSAGAHTDNSLSDCNIIFGVKEIPVKNIIAEKAYCFFSHTVKGQPHNMSMLQYILDNKATLIDYEKVSDENGSRLIFFGRLAGVAGMIRSLWAYGQRLEWEGIGSPFSEIKSAFKYHSLEEAKQAIERIGDQIGLIGLPESITPLICGFAGYGNVSQGAQEIIDLLPYREIAPENLQNFFERKDYSKHHVYKVIFKEKDLVKPTDLNHNFELLDYYQNPQNYCSQFDKYIPYLSILINAIYWEPQYPRLVTVDYLKKLFKENNQPRLRVIGDISCDIKGSIECTVEVGSFEKPVYVFNPESEKIQYGWEGNGPVVLAVDRLPNEFAKEATESFGEALFPFLPQLAFCNFSKEYDNLSLPPELKEAVIAHQGKLTPSYEYLYSALNSKIKRNYL